MTSRLSLGIRGLSNIGFRVQDFCGSREGLWKSDLFESFRVRELRQLRRPRQIRGGGLGLRSSSLGFRIKSFKGLGFGVLE